MKHLFFTLLFFLIIQVQAQPAFAKNESFNLSREIKKLQEAYGSDYTSYPIVIFDQDEISYRFAKANAFGEEGLEKRLQIIQNYVEEKAGLEITEDEADRYEPYLTERKNSALALPTLRGEWRNKKFALCGVLPASPNLNQRMETERLLGMNGGAKEEIYGHLTFDHYQEAMSYEQLAKFSLYHELSHCLDQTYFPKNYDGKESSFNIHQSESFAEALGYLLLRQQGHENLAKKRSILRATYALKVGKFFAQNPGNSFGNPHAQKGGGIYFLSPVLLKASEFTTFNRRDFEKMSLEDLRKKAAKIVDADALNSSVSLNALISYLKSKKGTNVVNEYRQKAYNDPSFYFGAFQDLLSFVNYTKTVSSRAFNPEADIPSRNGRLKEIDYQTLCQKFRQTKPGALFKEFQKLRHDLRTSEAPMNVQRKYAEKLNTLFKTLSKKCGK